MSTSLIEAEKLQNPARTGISRRRFLALLGIAGTASLISACSSEPKIPNLNLNIDEAGWNTALSKPVRWDILPDATEERNLNCPAWAPNICMGKVSNNLRIAVNPTLAEFLFTQAGMTNPPLPTRIVFVEDWGEKVSDEVHNAGFTAVTQDGKSQNIVMYLKYLAWFTMKQIDTSRVSPAEDHFGGLASYNLSVWTVHEMGHAGAELKALWKPGQPILEQLSEETHPQIYNFQRRYEALYNRAASQGRALQALVFGVELNTNFNQFRQRIYQEATNLGIKG